MILSRTAGAHSYMKAVAKQYELNVCTDMVNKVILWTAPRCLSTAFYRSISTLQKTVHFQELFSGPHYFGPERRNVRFPPDVDLGNVSAKDLTYDACKQTLLADYPDAELLFTKEMAYCLPQSMWHDMISGKLEDFTHTFLIRDPERAIYSNYQAILKDKVGDATLDPSEVGFVEVYKLYNFIKEKERTSPVLIDAVDLQTHPDETMKSYCEAVGIQFDPNMTKWEKGSSENRYKLWSPVWYSTVDQSTGFIKIKPEELQSVPLSDLPHYVIKYIDESRICYDEMRKNCLRPILK